MRKPLAVMGRLIGMIKPLAPVMVLAITLGVLGFFSATAISALTAYGLASAYFGEWSGPFLVAAILVCGFLRGPLRYGEQLCNHHIAFKILAIMRSQVFASLRKLAPAKLEGRDKGNLITLITSDIELLEVFYAHTISPAAIALIFCLISVAFLAKIEPLLALYAAFGYSVVGIGLPLYLSKRNKDLGLQARNAGGRLSGFVLDGLRGLREILQYRFEDAYLKKLDDMSCESIEANGRLKDETAFGMALTGMVLSLLQLGLVVLAGTIYYRGTADPVMLLTAVAYILSSYGPTLALAALGNTLQPTFAAGNRVLDILDEAPKVEEVETGAVVSFTGAALEEVDFSYEETSILKSMDLQVRKGEILGLRGKSGSGKSTILRLLMRFWDVSGGRVIIGDEDIRKVRTASLREAEGFMTQETYLFNDTIASNLRLARLDATEEEMEEACRRAAVHDFILTLPKGYDSRIGEMGSRLSSGERQRLGLARAFLHDAPFLLLDEPTSNLDSLNEAMILRSLKETAGDKTVLIVSHRPSSLTVADRIIGLETDRRS